MDLKRVTYIFRLVTLVATTVFSLIALIIAITELDIIIVQASSVLASAVLTIVFQTPMIVIDFLRVGAITSWVSVELVVLGFLQVLWGGAWIYLVTSASFVDGSGALIAVSLLVILFQGSYWTFLLVLAMIGVSRRRKTWKSTVRQADFIGAPPASTLDSKEASTDPFNNNGGAHYGHALPQNGMPFQPPTPTNVYTNLPGMHGGNVSMNTFHANTSSLPLVS